YEWPALVSGEGYKVKIGSHNTTILFQK
ncbi:putative permease of the drug/metabolite transporter, partial [Vibrio parahaemolyticus EKP-021]